MRSKIWFSHISLPSIKLFWQLMHRRALTNFLLLKILLFVASKWKCQRRKKSIDGSCLMLDWLPIIILFIPIGVILTPLIFIIVPSLIFTLLTLIFISFLSIFLVLLKLSMLYYYRNHCCMNSYQQQYSHKIHTQQKRELYMSKISRWC